MVSPFDASPLDQKLGALLGGRTAGAFERAFGMRTVGDLLAHYPRRYSKRGELTSIAGVPEGEVVTIVAEVVSSSTRPMRGRKGEITDVVLQDADGRIACTWFGQAYQLRELRPGRRGTFSGKVGSYKGTKQLTHPEYELFDEVELLDPLAAKRWADEPVPIYPATSTLTTWKVRQAIAMALDGLPPLEDPVPELVRAKRNLRGYRESLELIHRPASDADHYAARAALKFQEAFVLQSALLQQRERSRSLPGTAREAGGIRTGFDADLPFRLTPDQLLVGEEIDADLAQAHPMHRLVQGEVGSGKTLVALRAMLAVAQSGGQSALLAPTEVLAAQHLRSIVKSLGPDLAARLRPTLVTGQLSAAERRKALLAAAAGSAHIVVGTHALLGDTVTFADLGLVVVDEQHRFGVEQREALRRKSVSPPHVLVLTATPIPRTVAMTVFGDLDVSTIATLPEGRSPIASHVVALADHPGWFARVWQRMGEELDQGRQAFVVCPAIDTGQTEAADGGEPVDPDLDGTPRTPPATVLGTAEHLREHPVLEGRRLEVLHGRMSADEKDAVMRDFAAGRVHVLVATTVIEVGVDVPNASTMVVLDADRFGVSQLHQLRGRVGRGTVPGLALFVTAAEAETLARERVEAVASTTDGFELANRDLELRREGDVLGSTQSGARSSLRLLRAAKDGKLIAEARDLAASVLAGDPELTAHPALAAALARRLDESEREQLGKS